MRLFTGLSLPPAALHNANRILEELRPAANLKWSPLGNLHITLAFIGSWDEEQLHGLQGTLAKITGTPVPISIQTFGFFPNPHRPHSLFLGIKQEASLNTLVARVEKALEGLRWRREDRAYTPHVTLARVAGENITQLRFQIASMTNLFPFETFEATEFHLYQSHPTESGSVYTRLATFPLGDASR